MDYGHEAVREWVFRTIEEVCRNYDVDGVELDFFRSPVLFKSQAWGRAVTDAERDALTRLVRRVRAMADDVGARRGRPLLIAIRVPDSVRYCASMGGDLERWFADGLIDIYIPGGDFLLAPWESSVSLGHKYDVPVYPAITRAPTGASPGYEERAAPACYRARAMRAWGAGADGIYLFNVFDPTLPLWSELGDSQALRGTDKVYYGSEIPTRHATTYHPNGLDFRVLPTLSPEHPQQLKPGTPLETSVHVADDLEADRDLVSGVKLGLRIDDLKPEHRLSVSLSGHTLAKHVMHKKWMEFEAKPQWVTKGENRVNITIEKAALAAPAVSDIRIGVSYKSPPQRTRS